MQRETRSRQARARLDEITAEQEGRKARLDALRAARVEPPEEEGDRAVEWTLRVLLGLLLVGPTAVFLAVRGAPLAVNVLIDASLGAFVLFVPRDAVGPPRGQWQPETPEMKAEREALRALEREAENLYDDLDDQDEDEHVAPPVAAHGKKQVEAHTESAAPEREQRGYRDAAESVLARVEELRPKLEAREAERRTLERALLGAAAREPETDREEQARLKFRLSLSASIGIALGAFIGFGMTGDPLSKRITFGCLMAFIGFMMAMPLAITAGASRRTRKQRDALLVEAKNGKLGDVDVAASRARIAELERECEELEGEMNEARMLARVDTSAERNGDDEDETAADDEREMRR